MKPQYYTCVNQSLQWTFLQNLSITLEDSTQCQHKRIIEKDSAECQHKLIIENNSKNLSIAHLNTQSLCSTFDEFSVFVNTYCFDIMALTETWLKTINTC